MLTLAAFAAGVFGGQVLAQTPAQDAGCELEFLSRGNDGNLHQRCISESVVTVYMNGKLIESRPPLPDELDALDQKHERQAKEQARQRISDISRDISSRASSSPDIQRLEQAIQEIVEYLGLE